MRTLMTLIAVVIVTAAAVANDGCGGRYSGYPGWAQDAFCRPSGG